MVEIRRGVGMQGFAFSVATFFLIILLAGCASTFDRWVHPGRPGQSIEADRQACETVAHAEVPRPQAPPSVVNFTGLANLITMMDQAGLDRKYEAEVEQHVIECLKKKGWRPVESK